MQKHMTMLFSGLLVTFSFISAAAFAQTPTTPATPDGTAAPAATAAVAPPAPAFVEEWKPKLYWSGDMRYRLVRQKEDVEDVRNKQQLRVRLGLKADVNEDVQAIIRMMTATSAISGNQDLGDSKDSGMVRRPFGLDQAYINWKYFETNELWAGRTPNPFFQPGRTQILFDSDLSFEGLAVRFQRWGAFANLAGFMISENFEAGKDYVDQGIVGGDAGYKLEGRDWTWTSHVGYYNFVNVQNAAIKKFDASKGKADSYTLSTATPTFLGNRVHPDDLSPTKDWFLNSKFELVQVGTEWKHKAGPLEYSVWLDLLRNQRGGSYGDAVEYGASVKYWKVTLGYAYMTRRSESVLGAFTDSDFVGGGADNKGSRVSVSAQLAKNVMFAINQFSGRRGIDTVARNWNSTLVDLQVSF